ncbi:MAG: hypothetical protein V4556_13515 [Bacteroidota bacterium]
MYKKCILLLFIAFCVFNYVSAQKIPAKYFKARSVKNTRTLVVQSKTAEWTSVSFTNHRLSRAMLKKSPEQINMTYKKMPNISAFSYNRSTRTIKLKAPTTAIREILKKEFRFTDAELTAKGL